MNKTKLSNKLEKKKPFFKNIICKITKVNFVYAVLLLIIIFSIIVSPKKYAEVTLTGIRVWATAVLPALFPFMVFSKLLTSTGYVEKASKVFSNVTKKIYNCPGISSYVFLMSIIAGYPLGAKLISDLYLSKQISREEAHRICSFTSNSGPMFIVGTVGIGMLFSTRAAILIYVSHILGALLNGLIYQKYVPKEIKDLPAFSKNETQQSESDVLSKSMMDGINSILLVGGFITIFFVAIEVFSSLGIFKPLASIFSSFGLDENFSNGLIFGLFEITKGCMLISLSSVSLAIKTSVCCLIISLGGLAISFQALAFLNKFKISKKFFFLQKTTQGIISFLICLALSLIFI